jgi:hypothetical protein
MPVIIDYSRALDHMTSAGYRCNYYNSGAFGFKQTPLVRGWIGPPDASIRPELLAQVQFAPEPFAENLAGAAVDVWREFLPGAVWVMPMSHWHFELHDGSREWMPEALTEIGVDSKQLEERADGAAIEFAMDEYKLMQKFLESLLKNLRVSDFLISFTNGAALCNIHHNKQLWWTTTDASLIEKLDAAFTSQ